MQIPYWVMALLVKVMVGLVLRVVAEEFILYRNRRALVLFFRDPDH